MLRFMILMVFCLSGHQYLYSQQGESTLKIRGESEIAIKPDMVVISMNITTVRLDYQKTIEDLSGRIDMLTESLQKKGFKGNEIITNNFNISRNTIFKRGTRIDSGYIASQSLEVRFQYEKSKLLSVLNNTINSRANASLSISFDLTDEQKAQVKNSLIKLAVEDARKKATLITETAGYKISGIKEIIYGQDGRIFPASTGSFSREMTMAVEPQLNSMEAANLNFNDHVMIIYRIEPK